MTITEHVMNNCNCISCPNMSDNFLYSYCLAISDILITAKTIKNVMAEAIENL